MKHNVGILDRNIRLVAGILMILAAAGLFAVKPAVSWFTVIPAALGTVLLLTALIRICPLYLPFRINTGKKG